MRVSSWKRVGSMSQGSNRQGHRCVRWLATAQGEPMEIYLVSHGRTAVGHEDVIHTREREQVALALPEIAGRHHLGYALRCASLAGTSHQGIPRVTRAAIEDRAGFPLCRAIVVGFRWMVDLPGARDDASACVSERTEDEARERSQRAACRVEGTSEETDNVPTTDSLARLSEAIPLGAREPLACSSGLSRASHRLGASQPSCFGAKLVEMAAAARVEVEMEMASALPELHKYRCSVARLSSTAH